jgi:hypothetical protein
MAAISIKKVPKEKITHYTGSGYPDVTDALVTNIVKYKVGTWYVNTDNNFIYIRTQENGQPSDFVRYTPD